MCYDVVLVVAVVVAVGLCLLLLVVLFLAYDVPYVYVVRIFPPFPLPSGVAVIVVGGRPPRGDIPGRRPEDRARHRRRDGPQR